MFLPLDDWVLTRQVQPEAQTASGIIIPETAQKIHDEAVVIYLGPNANKTLRTANRVLVDRYAGHIIYVDGEELLLIRSADVIARVDLD